MSVCYAVCVRAVLVVPLIKMQLCSVLVWSEGVWFTSGGNECMCVCVWVGGFGDVFVLLLL